MTPDDGVSTIVIFTIVIFSVGAHDLTAPESK
jgi:hypothetical protein